MSIDIVHAWDLSNFKLSGAYLESLILNLNKFNVPIPKTQPSKEVVSMVEKIINFIGSSLESGSLPWFMVFSSSAYDLNMCSQVLPSSFAFTSGESASSTNLGELFKLFTSKKTWDEDGIDSAERRINFLSAVNLLVVDNISEGILGTAKYSGKFAEIFTKRASAGLPTVFNFVCPDFNLSKATVDRVYQLIESSVGSTVLLLMREKCSVIKFNSSPDSFNLKITECAL